jgi:hypothetical protein
VSHPEVPRDAAVTAMVEAVLGAAAPEVPGPEVC